MTTQEVADPVDELVELTVGSLAAGGGCVGRHPDGRVVFVRHTLPGERVRARITSATTHFYRADAIDILDPSPDRVEPPCPHAGPGRCGGCDYQHVALEAQRRLKASRLGEQLQHVASVHLQPDVEPVAGDVDGLGWRTRLRVALDEEGRPGFRKYRSHALELVERCAVAHPAIGATGALTTAWPGGRELEVMVGGADDTVVALSTDERRPGRWPSLDGGAGLSVDGKVVKLPRRVSATVLGHRFRISPGVFWQGHAGAAETLGKCVLDMLAPRSGETVGDLYAGAGLFAVLVAHAVGSEGRVVAVERHRRACDDARANARALPQVQVLHASVTPRLIERELGQSDLLVLDPARVGAGTAVMRALRTHVSGLRRLVYVSCDAASFSRDAKELLDHGWNLTALRAFDIFPMTEHIELVASFEPG